MSENNSLQAIQQKTLRMMNFQDGLWDIMLGLIFLTLSIYPLTRAIVGPVWNLGLFLIVLSVLVIAWFTVRRVVSVPRLGHARPRRTPKLRLLLLITAVMVALTLGLVVVTLIGSSSATQAINKVTSGGRSYLVEWITVIAIGLIFSGLGYTSGVIRLYIYGWLLGLANLASVYMQNEAGWTFMLPLAIVAGLILVTGFVLFIRFIDRFPHKTQAG